MRVNILTLSLLLLMSTWQNMVFSQTVDLHGQVSGWVSGYKDESPGLQTGLRYIPEVFLKNNLNDDLFIDAEISINTYITGDFSREEDPEREEDIKPYRIWTRFRGEQFEARIGLQKINFGSATLFRPLMWFDLVDPRDPLKMTDVVYALLLRYYFQNNANIWLWGLYNLTDDLKGWETVPTEDKGLEFGGRLQLPVFIGEAAVSYHHRRADFSQIQELALLSGTELVNEDRYAFDTKWDVIIGLWFEGTVTRRDTDIPLMRYHRMWTVGADYTFDIGNGLNILAELFNSENSTEVFEEGEEIKFIGSSVNYPVTLLDRVSGIYYYDLTNRENYISLSWERKYDDWAFHLIAFFNPDRDRLNESQSSSNLQSGKGFQIMAVYNY